ncbi:hypothetical protein NS228_19670 [Methylobacterium indicum]|uniref:MucR family transcriptional regulator n=1 Tax=Methylobacterium indicum TaxID=1775910 RepID=A0A8H9C6H9_9HYPH|nr:MucR family transcriptional regulator [Methylobacterium indicum]KTS36796.1 hypothetical protein NS229_09305 [Methylobacterium indicum]KTS37158.1 hypothetical protein NS228_19670 [Methylobacterium indicum]KTS54763.1 hypothetical protein NS230_00450 [Methylobacterium indicum]BCM85277.1 hypothetical protein mvi_37380 [Methylobacterium indicum]
MGKSNLLKLTSAVTAAYVTRNRVHHSEIAEVIVRVHTGLRAVTMPRKRRSRAARRSEAQIAASVQRNRIVSFIDGKPYKSLKWHLAAHGITPEEYRDRFGLPETYPMVAPSYDKAVVYERADRGGAIRRKP